jgi:hypothetical protein
VLEALAENLQSALPTDEEDLALSAPQKRKKRDNINIKK